MLDETIESVLQKHTRRIMSLPGVVSLGEGELEGKLCIKVYVVRRTPQLLTRIPSILEGYAVFVEETGDFRALGQQ
jgi:hypothetical protein